MAKGTAQTNAFGDLEGELYDLRCMARIANELVLKEFSDLRPGMTDPIGSGNDALFAVSQVTRMVEALLESYHRAAGLGSDRAA